MSEYSSPVQVVVTVIGMFVAAVSLINCFSQLSTPDASTVTSDKSKLAQEGVLYSTQIRPSTQSDLDSRYMLANSPGDGIVITFGELAGLLSVV